MGTAVMLDALQTPRLLLVPGTTQGSGTNCSPQHQSTVGASALSTLSPFAAALGPGL